MLYIFASVTIQVFFLFFFNDTATTEIYTLSLHDALPISARSSPTSTSSTPSGWPRASSGWATCSPSSSRPSRRSTPRDRKSTRLNSSHANISYAVFCLKKKKNQIRGGKTSEAYQNEADKR